MHTKYPNYIAHCPQRNTHCLYRNHSMYGLNIPNLAQSKNKRSIQARNNNELDKSFEPNKKRHKMDSNNSSIFKDSNNSMNKNNKNTNTSSIFKDSNNSMNTNAKNTNTSSISKDSNNSMNTNAKDINNATNENNNNTDEEIEYPEATYEYEVVCNESPYIILSLIHI